MKKLLFVPETSLLVDLEPTEIDPENIFARFRKMGIVPGAQKIIKTAPAIKINFVEVEITSGAKFPFSRVICPDFSFNIFCDVWTLEKQKRMKHKKETYYYTGRAFIKREVDKGAIIKEYLKAGTPEKWTPDINKSEFI